MYGCCSRWMSNAVRVRRAPISWFVHEEEEQRAARKEWRKKEGHSGEGNEEIVAETEERVEEPRGEAVEM